MNWFGLLSKHAQTEIAPPAVAPAPASQLPAHHPSPVPAPAAAPAGAAPTAPLNVVAEVTQNQYGSSFLVLSGDTFSLNKKLNLGRTGMGFNWFGAKKQWSKKLELLTEQDVQALEGAGVNLSVLRQPEYAQMVGQRSKAADPNAPQTPASEKIQQFRDEINKAVGSGGGSERVKAITQHVDKTLERLAGSVDEAAKQNFVKAFLVFASKFWQYSFHNQLLIYMQKPDATYCRGPRQWEKMGRKVVNPQNGITILSPRFPKEKDAVGEETADEGGAPMPTPKPRGKMQLTGKQPASRRPMFFVPVEVFDISDTQPIEGWTDKATGAGPFEGKPPLKTNPNEPSEHVDMLVHAASNFAAEKGIKLDLDKELPEDLGGYSQDENVVVNKQYKGVNQFSTLVHELAHWYLHQFDNAAVSDAEIRSLGEHLGPGGERVMNDLIANNGNKFKTERAMIEYVARSYSQQVALACIRWYKQKREIEAESTAYIVLQHFGLDTKDAPNYLALWKADAAKVRSRRDNIVKAVQAIVQGIESEMHEVPVGQPMQPDGGMVQQASSANWYKLACSYQNGSYRAFSGYRCNCYGCGRESVRVSASEIMAKRSDPAGWRCPTCLGGKKTATKPNSPPVERDRSFLGELMGRYKGVSKAKDRLGTTASQEVEARVNPEVGTNFANWFNSSVGNGFGSLDEDEGSEGEKKDKKPSGHPMFDQDNE